MVLKVHQLLSLPLAKKERRQEQPQEVNKSLCDQTKVQHENAQSDVIDSANMRAMGKQAERSFKSPYLTSPRFFQHVNIEAIFYGAEASAENSTMEGTKQKIRQLSEAILRYTTFQRGVSSPSQETFFHG